MFVVLFGIIAYTVFFFLCKLSDFNETVQDKILVTSMMVGLFVGLCIDIYLIIEGDHLILLCYTVLIGLRFATELSK